VSGAQLSNYATFLVHPEQAALSIVLTALSTAAGVVVTPLLVLLVLGQRIPVDVQGMAASIMQIVILPVGIGRHFIVYASKHNQRM
jgi:predicted Na+-dependent transporter